MSSARRYVAVVSLAAALSLAGCGGSPAPAGTPSTEATSSAAELLFDGDLDDAILPIPAGAKEKIALGGADRELEKADLEAFYGNHGMLSMTFERGVIQQWEQRGVVTTIMLFDIESPVLAQGAYEELLEREQNPNGTALAATGATGKVFVTKAGDGHPTYATAVAYQRDIVVCLSVYGGTEASAKEQTQKLTVDQFTRFSWGA